MLRKQGRTYSEISHMLGSVPKGTLSYWLGNIRFTPRGERRHRRVTARRLHHARKKATQTKLKMRTAYFNALRASNEHLMAHVKNKEVAKLLLVLLYAAEGAKGKNTASLVFGNSDSRMIQIFLALLRGCYPLDERKFRCTVQCRADMPQKALERFWSRATGIPIRQFYETRIDPRTAGKRTRKPAYRGVCRVQYFSAGIFHELMTIFEIISKSV